MKKYIALLLISVSCLTGCDNGTKNFPTINEKVGTDLPTNVKNLFHHNEHNNNGDYEFNIFKVNEKWDMTFNIRYQSDWDDKFEINDYITLINEDKKLNIPEQYKIPLYPYVNWASLRERGDIRNYEWTVFYVESKDILYTLAGTHTGIHQIFN